MTGSKTYILSEVPKNSDNENLTKTWKPNAAGYSCKYGATGDEQVKKGEITIAASSDPLVCKVTNTAAVFSVLTYDEATGKNIPYNASNVRFTYEMKADDENTATTSTGWHEKDKIGNSTGFLTPNAKYSFNVTDKPVAAYTKLQKYKGAAENYNDSQTAASYWEDVEDPANITLEPNKKTIFRVVVNYTRPTLPLTGGMGADQFILLGFGLLFVAGSGSALVYWRRRSRA